MRSVPVFVNGELVDVPADSPVLDVVRQWNAEAARDIERGARALTDSRGLPLDPASIAAAGTIVRVLSAREGDSGAEDLH